MCPIGADHTERKTAPVVEGIDVAPITDATTGTDAYTEQLRAFYGGKQFEYGWASLCKMTVPDDLEGKTTLDIGCRRGRGVYKLSGRVGKAGRAIGLDWGVSYIEEAAEWSAHAASKSGLTENNIAFILGFPEDLEAGGIQEGSIDMVWVNSVINLVFDRARCLREIYRVLKPGGILVCEMVTADGARDEGVVERAKAIGNSIQAAPSRETFMTELLETGFAAAETIESHEVAVDAGFKPGYAVETVVGDEEVSFTAEVFKVAKC